MPKNDCKEIFYNSEKSKSSWGIEPWPPRWQANTLPLDQGFIDAWSAKNCIFNTKRGGPTGPPPGSQAYKLYVGSNRVKIKLFE